MYLFNYSFFHKYNIFEIHQYYYANARFVSFFLLSNIQFH